MAQQSVGLFGLKVVPGEEHELDAFGDVRITNIALGEKVTGNRRTVVRVHHRPVPSFDDDSSDEEDDDEEDEDKKDEDKDDDKEEEEEQTFVVCSLYPGQIEQVAVDLHISVEDDVRFSVTGDNPVEILGSYLSPGTFDDDPDSDELDDPYSDSDEEIDSDELEMMEAMDGDSDDDDDDIELEEDEDDDEDDEMNAGRIEEITDDDGVKALVKPAVNGVATKKRSAAEADISRDDDDDIEDDESGAPVTDAELAKAAKEMGIDVSKLTKNQRKKLNKRLRAEVNGDDSAEVAQEKVQVVQKDPKDGKVKAQTATKEVVKKDGKPTSKKITLPSGVVIEDMKLGTGPQAKAGNRLGMRYVGRLQNGKQFDANTKGKPFAFKLGKGEVIGGWDEGLKGMQVGGERRLTIPPKMGYGARGAPPDIPGNSTLVFDVKLVEIK